MDDVNRHITNLRGVVLGASRHRNRSSKEVWMAGRKKPGTPASHAEARDENPLRVDRIASPHVIDEFQYSALTCRIRPPAIGHVRSDDDTPPRLQRRADHSAKKLHPIAGTRRSTGMQRQHQRDRFGCIVVAGYPDAIGHQAHLVDVDRRVMQPRG